MRLNPVFRSCLMTKGCSAVCARLQQRVCVFDSGRQNYPTIKTQH